MNLSLLLIMSGVISFSYWLEAHTRWFAHISGILLIIIFASILGSSGIVPSSDESYGIYIRWVMPLGIILLLLAFNPTSIMRLNKKFLICFSIGAIGTSIGGIVAGLLFCNQLPEDYWRISGQFTASFIGGYENAVAVGTAVNTPIPVFLKAFAGDSVITSIWIIINILQCKKLKLQNNVSIQNKNFNMDTFSGSLDIVSVAITVTVAIAILEISYYMHAWFPLLPQILYASMIATLMTFTPLVHRFSGSYIFGTFILSYFIFVCGAISNVPDLFNNSIILLLFPVTILLVHAIILFGIAKIFKIEKEIVIITSQCLIGGPATALAVVAAGKLNYQMEAIALGLLGYAVGNYFGFGVAWILK